MTRHGGLETFVHFGRREISEET